jgi:Xaa-Pro aminopeptidase
MNQQALGALRAWMTAQGVDAFLVKQPQNRSYLSGWLNDDNESGAGMLLIGQGQQILLTSTLYKEIAEKEAVGWQVVVPEGREYDKTIVELAKQHGWQRIGFESSAMTVAAFERLNAEGRDVFTLQSFEKSYVSQVRQVKQPQEIEKLKRAIEITDQTFAHICRWMEPGMTEKEISWEISRYMVELGADGTAFETIIASGPNGSMPHARPGQRRIERGELITIDMGARYQGYCADMTRTVSLGEPKEPRMREIYEAVLNALQVSEQRIHAGLTGVEADALARDALDAAGLGEYYVHGTGHGVGLQVHEHPHLSKYAPPEEILPVGSVVTIEPGVYIPGWSGARVEDCVLLTEDGCEVLTRSPKTLVIQE